MGTETKLEEGAFDVLSFIETVNYPEAEVVVFLDSKSADEYVKTVEKRNIEEPDADGPLTQKIEELAEKIKASSIIFKLRGMPPGHVRAIIEAPEGEEDNEAASAAREDELVAKTIIEVRNHEGVVDPKPVTAETIQTFRTFLKEGEFGKLVRGVAEVNFNAAVFDNAVDAGFSSGSDDLGE